MPGPEFIDVDHSRTDVALPSPNLGGIDDVEQDHVPYAGDLSDAAEHLLREL